MTKSENEKIIGSAELESDQKRKPTPMSVTNERSIRIAMEKTSNLRVLFLQHMTIAILRWTNERIWTMDHTCLLMMVVEALNLRGGPMDRRPPPGLSTQGRI